jgi:hypothetical protein
VHDDVRRLEEKASCALIQALEARGYAVEVDAEGKQSTSVIVQEERVFFYLDEKIARIDHAPTADERLESERRGWNTWPQHDYVASGALHLKIVDSDFLRVRTKWVMAASSMWKIA